MISSSLPIPNSGILHAKIPDKIYQRIISQLVDSRESVGTDASHKLAGHLKDEYYIEDKEIAHSVRDFVNILIREYYVDYGFTFPHMMPIFTPAMDIWNRSEMPDPHYDVWMGEDKNGYVKRFKQTKLWINYQKQNEFNPPHIHSGDFSMVMFIKIPYLKKDEESFLDRRESITDMYYDVLTEEDAEKQRTLNLNGNFGIFASNVQGQQQILHLSVDKTWEGTMLLFPSNQLHFVHPFYSSDEERITISGNYILDRLHSKEFETTLKYE